MEKKTSKLKSVEDNSISIDFDLFKKNKVRCIIIYPDNRAKEFFRKLDGSFFITIKKGRYFVMNDCIINLKIPTCVWYYNNPFPIRPVFERTKLTALNMYDKEEEKLMDEEKKSLLAKIHIDSEALHSAFESDVIKKFYAGEGMKTKSFLMIIIVVFVIVLTILHLTGVVDVMALLGAGGG